MTRIYLTDEDYEVINSGDINRIKQHFNSVRGELVLAEVNKKRLENGAKRAYETLKTALCGGFIEGTPPDL